MMSGTGKAKPTTKMLPLCDLVPRADRANVLSRRTSQALAGHISRSGRYPALIVRPDPKREGKYEILDGCGRAEVLRGLGLARARCEVWPVGAEEASILAATLNQLRGRPSAIRRARKTRRLVRQLGAAGALAALAMTPAALRQQFTLLGPPEPTQDPRPLDLQPLVFHLSADKLAFVERKLRAFTSTGDRRGDALLKALRAACHHSAAQRT